MTWVAKSAYRGVLAPPAGMLVWLKADKGTYSDNGLTTPVSTDGSTVKGWADQSGNTNNATGGNTFASSLVLKTNIQNGLPVLRASGSANIGLTTGTLSPSITYPWTAFIVIRVSTWANGARILRGNQSSGVGDCLGLSGSSPNFGISCDDFSGTILTDSDLTVNTFGVLRAIYQGSQTTTHMQLQVNAGTTQDSDLHHTASTTALQIANRATNGSSPLTGDIGEIIVYNGALTAGQQSQAISYLRGRWGI